jgi:hypothetical protein
LPDGSCFAAHRRASEPPKDASLAYDPHPPASHPRSRFAQVSVDTTCNPR